ncbi:MAG: putative peptidoglycan-binding protein, partial [Bryobacterales bacterium]|nr:putative peptidoglycan-binding protein [Bryobacterales bacterium]
PCDPLPGDLVFWWRESLNGPKGHVGMVHQLKDGMLYTIEGNRSSTVQGFSYVASRMDKLLGFGQLSAVNG